jgi:hypothetical protein
MQPPCAATDRLKINAPIDARISSAAMPSVTASAAMSPLNSIARDGFVLVIMVRLNWLNVAMR